ncbi:hypothetical protein GGR58DRAFT_521433 [Xylaria digitata]|nr:hypothetical protein GGR58DRAFT_521433 [Xylaria digitata]
MADTTNIPEEINQSQPPPPRPPPLPNLLPRQPIPIGPRAPSATSALAQKRAKMAALYGLADSPREPHPPLFTRATFKPCHMFFYGTLMDPDVLQHITGCPTKPAMRPGWIMSFRPKMWVYFPTLIPLEELSLSAVSATEEAKLGQGRGRVYGGGDARMREIEDYQHFWALQQYETSVYRGYWCQIHAGDNSETIEDSVVFVWAKKPQSPDLTDGAFDLAKWQKTHKASLCTPDKEKVAARE